jgi:hypothetical protein
MPPEPQRLQGWPAAAADLAIMNLMTELRPLPQD